MSRRREVDPTYKPYDPEFHPQDLIKQMSDLKLNVEVAKAWNISMSTFVRWRKEHEELEEAYQKGLTFYEAEFIDKVFKPMIQGNLEGKHAYNAAKAIMTNKLNWNFGNPVETHRNTQINIDKLQINNSKSAQELIDIIEQDITYLTDNGVLSKDLSAHEPVTVEVKELAHDSKPDRQDT